METIKSLLDYDKQNFKLPIRIVSPNFGHMAPELVEKFGLTHRRTHYFFLFMLEGLSQHSVDLQHYEIKENEMLLVMPHQMHRLPGKKHKGNYFKLGFDEACLSLLPKQYPFLINPFNRQKVLFNTRAALRLKSIFEILRELLSDVKTDPELILAHLNSLLTEINTAYFTEQKGPTDERLSKFIGFKTYIEINLTEHPTIVDIAKKLALNTNSLYNIVKQYSGLSPKAFITRRLILEAKRRLYYSESPSIKQLAFELGFNDPEYFSRSFKKVTGKTIAMFIQDLS